MVRAIQLSVEAVDRRLEQAASTLGANPLFVFFTVTLPLILPGMIAGAILCFARAMGEFGATITFVSNIPGETQTLPTLIYTFTQVPGGEAGALRLTLISVAISLGAVLASEAFVTAACSGETAPISGPAQGMTATPQGRRPTGTDFSAFRLSTSMTVMSLVRPLAT